MSQHFTDGLVKRLAQEQRIRALVASMHWLLQAHPGLHHYEGVVGRVLRDDERDDVALEAGLVSELDCPLWIGRQCVIGGLGPRFNERDEAFYPSYGFLPMLLARAIDYRTVRDLAVRRLIADAKTCLLSRNRDLPTKGGVLVA